VPKLISRAQCLLVLTNESTETVTLQVLRLHLLRRLLERGFHVTAMPAAAQATRAYDDYLDTLACTEADELSLLALGLIGPRNRVTKLVRRLELLP